MIFGVIGFLGSGKSTICEILKQDQGYSTVSFAKALKDAAAVMFGWKRELLEGDTLESRIFRETIDPWWSSRLGYSVTPRLFLQLLGTQAGRNVFSDKLWLVRLEREIEELQSSNIKNIAISDARFPNELEFIRKLGGKIIWVQRGELPEWYEDADEDNSHGTETMVNVFPDVHYSEWAWVGSKVDYVVKNDGTIDDLRNNIKRIVKGENIL